MLRICMQGMSHPCARGSFRVVCALGQCVCARAKAWLAVRVSLRLARMPRLAYALAAAPVLFRTRSVIYSVFKRAQIFVLLQSRDVRNAVIILWDTRTWLPIQRLEAHSLSVLQLQFSADDR
jgi:hypothetical protein